MVDFADMIANFINKQEYKKWQAKIEKLRWTSTQIHLITHRRLKQITGKAHGSFQKPACVGAWPAH